MQKVTILHTKDHNYSASDKVIDRIFFQFLICGFVTKFITLSTLFRCIYMHINEYTYLFHEEIEL